jgi:hypothetical protein
MVKESVQDSIHIRDICKVKKTQHQYPSLSGHKEGDEIKKKLVI